MAVTWFVATTGSDTNGGSSDGAAKASGAGGGGTGATWTNGVTTITLPAGTNLSTTVAGDAIRLATATGGVRGATGGVADVFEVATVNDGADTLTVTSAPTSNGTDQAFAIGGSLAGIQRAVDSVRGAETVNIKATGTYSPATTITFPSSANWVSAGVSGTAPVLFQGFTTTVGDGGIVTVSGASLAANSAIVLGVVGANHFVWKNFIFSGATGTGIGFDVGGAGAGSNGHFRRCRFTANGGRGWRAGSGACTLVLCMADANGNNGYESVATSNTVWIACIANGNTGDGFNAASGGVWYRCSAFSNSGDNYEPGGAFNVLFDCTQDGDADDSDVGYRFSGGSTSQIQVLVNCIVYDNATGVISATNIGEKRVSFNNLVNANATAYSGFATESGEVTSAPQFVNEAGGDYGIVSGSPARSAGLDLSENPWGVTFTGRSADIGAVVGPDVGGGGGGRGQIQTGGRM